MTWHPIVIAPVSGPCHGTTEQEQILPDWKAGWVGFVNWRHRFCLPFTTCRHTQQMPHRQGTVMCEVQWMRDGHASRDAPSNVGALCHRRGECCEFCLPSNDQKGRIKWMNRLVSVLAGMLECSSQHNNHLFLVLSIRQPWHSSALPPNLHCAHINTTDNQKKLHENILAWKEMCVCQTARSSGLSFLKEQAFPDKALSGVHLSGKGWVGQEVHSQVGLVGCSVGAASCVESCLQSGSESATSPCCSRCVWCSFKSNCSLFRKCVP